MRIFIKLRIENHPDFEQLSPFILAPNHTSFCDPPVFQWACSHHVTFLMTEIIYRQRLSRWVFRLWEAIPVPEGRNAAVAIKGALEALKRGRPVVIFPEGRISNDGCLNEGRGGIAILLAKARVPVIPVAILGAFEVLPRHRRWPRRGTITVRFGEPILPPGDGAEVDPRAFASTIMDAIAALGAPRRQTDQAQTDR